MGRYDRNAYFEQLVALKLRPAGEDDRRSAISIEDAIVYAEAVMLSSELELEAAAADDAAAVESGAAADAAASRTTPPDRSARSRRLMDGWFGPARRAQPDLGRDDRR